MHLETSSTGGYGGGGRPATTYYGGGGRGGTGNSDGPGGQTGGSASTGGGGGGGREAGNVIGSGGSGIVVVRYQIASTLTAKATGGAISFYNGKTIHTFTSSGTFTIPTGLMKPSNTSLLAGRWRRWW